MKKNCQTKNVTQGFTIVELLIAMVVAGIVTMATYSVYVAQQGHYAAQTQVTEMQQNKRALLDLMTSDIRMAGFDGGSSSVAEITAAKPDLFSFTIDLDESGEIDVSGEHIAYDLYNKSDNVFTLGRSLADNDDDLAVDQGSDHWEATGHAPVADNIEHLEFHYLDIDNNTLTTSVPDTDLDKITTVEISILLRAGVEDPKFTNKMTYTTAGGTDWGPKDDHYRRRFQTMTVECRNANL